MKPIIFYIHKFFTAAMYSHIMVCFLSFMLQGKSCSQSSSGGLTLCRELGNHLMKLPPDQFRQEIDNTMDISKSRGGHNYLYLAVLSGDLGKVEIILDRINQDRKQRKIKGIDPIYNFYNEPDPDTGQTALAYAINRIGPAPSLQDISLGILNTLTRKDRAYIELYNEKLKFNALEIALKRYPGPAAELILKAEKNREPEEKCGLAKHRLGNGCTPLHVAISKYQFNPYEKSGKDLIKLILEQLDTVDDLCSTDVKKRTPLHRLARNKEMEMFKILFEKICNTEECKVNKKMIIECLLKKDKNEFSVFANTYLPKHINKMAAFQGLHQTFSSGKKMFTAMLELLKKVYSLTWSDRIRISNEMDALTKRGLVSKVYVRELEAILDKHISIRTQQIDPTDPITSNWPVAEVEAKSSTLPRCLNSRGRHSSSPLYTGGFKSAENIKYVNMNS